MTGNPPNLFATLPGMARAFDRCWQFLLLLPCAFAVSDQNQPPLPSTKATSTNSNTIVELKGHVTMGPTGARDPLKFKTETGQIYSLVSNQMSTALFVDTNLHSKFLLLKGRVSDGTQRFEVTGNLRSIKGGKVHELYYYCDICAIKTSDPAICMCCREPVYLVEEPR
jgi:hypothetical protein